MMRRRTIFSGGGALAATLLLANSAAAQHPDWTAFLTVRPDPSPYVADWETDPSIVTLVLSYTGSQNAAFHLEGTIRRGQAVLLSGRSAPFEFVGPSQLLLTTRDGIWEANSVTYEPTVASQLEQTGRLPDGEYEMCVDVHEGLPGSGGQLFTRACAPFAITAPQPPSLIAPSDGSALENEYPPFIWTPVVTGFNAEVSYHIRIAEMLPYQSPLEAINNLPHVEADVSTTTFLYPVDALPLEDSTRYVWQVQALDEFGAPLGERQGKSEIWTFTRGQLSGGTPVVDFLDRVTLIAGVADLDGLATLEIYETAFAYILNGQAWLDIMEPFAARVDVQLENLEIAKESIDTEPVYLAGRVHASLGADVVPPEIGGRLVGFSTLEYTPASGLRLAGRLAVYDEDVATLTGWASVSAAGLAGTLIAEAPNGQSLFVLGEDPVRVPVHRVRYDLPETQGTLTGSVDLFDGAVACDDVQATVDTEGTATLDAVCIPADPIPLLPGVDRATLTIASVTGQVEFDLVDGTAEHHALEAPLRLSLDATAGGSNCGADLTLSVVDGEVALVPSSFDARCDALEGSVKLGWLRLRLSNLLLDRFAYSPRSDDEQEGAGGTWDFAFQLDIQPEIPTLPNLDLPSLENVSLSPGGIDIPSVDLTMALPAIRMAGIDVAITRVGLPSFTLPWLDWQRGASEDEEERRRAGDRFDFNLDLRLRFPELPLGTPACLATESFEVEGAELASGRLAAALGEVVFDPACPLPLGLDVAFEVDRISGEVAVAVAPQVELEQGASVHGALTLPDFFSCGDTDDRLAFTTDLELLPDGALMGTVEDLHPPCPIDLAALSLDVTAGTLAFRVLDDDSQSVRLSGSATAEFSGGDTPVQGDGTFAVELLTGQFSGSVTFRGPFAFDLPRSDPLLAFQLDSATLDTTGLRINGAASLTLPGDGADVPVVFDDVIINPRTLAVTSGAVRFDAEFGLEVGIADDRSLSWRSVASGAAVETAVGMRLDVPVAAVIDHEGLRVSGDAFATLIYGGRELDSLRVVFSDDFAVSLRPVAVQRGMADLRYGDTSVGYLDALGFHPNLAYLAGEILPDRLGLPVPEIAYLQLRDGEGDLLVDVSNSGSGVRIVTPPDSTVPLVFPSLAPSDGSAPVVDVQFDLLVDPLARQIAAGDIHASIPPGQETVFDLTASGIPFVVDSIAYERGDGMPYRIVMAGRLTLFDEIRQTSPRAGALLTLDGTGTVRGDVLLTDGYTLPLVAGNDRLTLRVDTLEGSFDAVLSAPSPAYSLDLVGGLELRNDGGEVYRADATVRATDQEVFVSEIDTETSADGSPLDLGFAELALSRMRVPYLSYQYATRQWDFELLFDVTLRIPALDSLELPPLEDVALRPDGFTIPEYDVPEINVDPFPIGTFELTPLAFRSDSLRYDWQVGESADEWGFGVDLAVEFGELPPDVPGELEEIRLTVLDAGYRDGRLSGEIEVRDLPDSIDIDIGERGMGVRLASLGGVLDARVDTETWTFTDDPDQVQITAVGAFVLPETLRCDQISSPIAPMADDTLTVSGAGWVSGTVRDFLPACPLAVGPLEIAIANSTLQFFASSGAQQVAMDLDGTLALPGPSAGDTITAAGQLSMDLVRMRVVSGFIEINEPFRWNLPASDPLLSFTVNQARVDTAGLRLSGAGSLDFFEYGDVDVDDVGQAAAVVTGSVDVAFDDLTLAFPHFRISGGRADITQSFALDASFEQDGSMQWRAADRNTPTEPAPPAADDESGDTFEGSFRITLPDTVALVDNGLQIAGTATAAVTLGDSALPELRVDFLNQFVFGYQPVAVRQGRADFVLDSVRIAYLDSTGFWPGDVLAVLPIPDRLGLPTDSVAYVQLRDSTGTLFVESETGPDGMAIRTKDAQTVPLVVPALAAEGQPAPSVAVVFEIVVNPGNMRIVSGDIRATADSGEVLLSLMDVGLPLEIAELAYEEGDAGYALHLDARLALPESMGALDVVFRDVVVSEDGLSGTAEVGTYLDSYIEGTAAIADLDFDDVNVGIYGARLSVSDETVDVRFAGSVTTTLFRDSEGEPAVTFFTGEYEPGGFVLSVDPASWPEHGLPIALAMFEPVAVGDESAVSITATDEDLTLRLNGILRLPELSDEFAATIEGLEVGTRGVSFPTVSITDPEDLQRFSLFGATFTLQDVQGEAALAFAYADGVVTVTMSGEITFLDNTSTFYGLHVSTDGQATLAGASLISEPIVLAQDLLTLDSLTIRDNHLRADLGVTLPAPVDDGGTQHVHFTVAPDGAIDGGANLALKDEDPGLGGDRTQFNLGMATMHPRYLGLVLEFSDMRESAVEVVADAYVAHREDNRIKLGDVDGGVAQPGLRITFEGDVTWGNVELAREFEFDFEAVELAVRNVSVSSADDRFAVGFSGDLSLNLPSVSGSIDFVDFRIDDRGSVRFNPSGITGGTLSIAGVVNLEVEGFEYSNTATTIEVAGGSMPGDNADASAETTEVDVASFVRFGGKIDVVDVLAGGVEEFLVFRTAEDGKSHLIVRNASLGIYDVLTMQADLRYRELAGGFEMVLGASGSLLDAYEVALVGAIERSNETTRAGIFVSAGVSIPLTPITPVAMLTQVGGGFFYNPKPEYLELVRQYANVSQTAGEQISAPAGRYAVLLYAAAQFPPVGVAEGRILLTITPTALQLDGAVEILRQGDRLRGEAHLLIGIGRAYAEGNIAFNVDYDPVLNGAGQLAFYLYGPDTWGIIGSSEVDVVNVLHGGSEIFIGPPGFIVSANIEGGFDVWLIAIRSGFEATAWYHAAAQEWGAHAAITVSVSVLGGAASAEGTLQGALILAQGSPPALYAAGDLSAHVAYASWSGSIWAKFENGRADGGFGRDPAMDEALARAQETQEEMAAAQGEAEDAVAEAQEGTLAVTAEELAKAYERIQGWPESRFDAVFSGSEYVEDVHAPIQPGEPEYREWYRNVLRQVGAPKDTSDIVAYREEAARLIDAINAARSQVSERIGQVSTDLQELESAATAPIPESPVRGVSHAAPVTHTQINAAGDTVKVLESGPDFDVDATAAQVARAALEERRRAAADLDQRIREQIGTLESGLSAVRAVTTDADDGSLLSFARLHAEAGAVAEQQYAAHARFVLERQDWIRARLAEAGQPSGAGGVQAVQIGGRYPTIRRIVHDKTAAVHAESPSDLKQLTAWRWYMIDQWLDDNAGRANAYAAASADRDDDDPWFTEQADSSGMLIWYHLAHTGLTAANEGVDTVFAEIVTQADQRLATIRDRHIALSASLDRLYGGQAALTGALYDIYDRYLYWHAESVGDSTLASTDMSSFGERRDVLAQELTVPTLNGVQVTAIDNGYTATLNFQWSGWHPNGTYEFRYRDVTTDDAALGAPMLSNGPLGSRTAYRFMPARDWQEPLRSFEVGVRGGAGFVALGRTDYQVSFTPGAASTGGATTYTPASDDTPPSPPIVSFPGRDPRSDANGAKEAWTSDANRIAVQWSAYDGQSGIAEYEFAVGTEAGGTTIRDWQSAGGRTSVTVERLNIAPTQPVYISARARNGEDLWSDVGVSPALRLDVTAPTFPAGATLLAGAVTDGATLPLQTIQTSGCPVPEPSHPTERDDAAVASRSPTAAAVPISWNGDVGLDDGGRTRNGASPTPPREPPRRSFTRPTAEDRESGLRAYYWRADTVPPTEYTGAGWTEVPSSTPEIVLEGAPLDYERAWYVAVVGVNYAGLTTEPVTFGPFTVPDPTPPTAPSLCASAGTDPDRLTVQIDRAADDRETAILGYQYRVHDGTNVIRDWSDETIDWTQDGADRSLHTDVMALEDGASYWVDIRAINGHQQASDTVTSGPVFIDTSPPPAPQAAPQVIDATTLSVRITAPADPESGLTAVQLAVGTNDRSDNVVAWHNVSGDRDETFDVDMQLSSPLLFGSIYWVQVRSVNGAGVASPIQRIPFTAALQPRDALRRTQ